MHRRLVLLRRHETLLEGWRRRAFGPAGGLLRERLTVSGATVDEAYHPVRVLGRIGPPSAWLAASGACRCSRATATSSQKP